MNVRIHPMVVFERSPMEAHQVPCTCLHHRRFPENWARGETPLDAARNLLQHLERELDSISSTSRRAEMEEAIRHVQESITALEAAEREPEDAVPAG